MNIVCDGLDWLGVTPAALHIRCREAGENSQATVLTLNMRQCAAGVPQRARLSAKLMALNRAEALLIVS